MFPGLDLPVSIIELVRPWNRYSFDRHFCVHLTIWYITNSKCDTMVPRPTARLHILCCTVLDFLESDMISPRNVMSSLSHTRYLDTIYGLYKTPTTLCSGWRWFSVWTCLEAWQNDWYPPHRLIRCLSRYILRSIYIIYYTYTYMMRCIWSAIRS